MTDIEKNEYNTLKAHYPTCVVLMRVSDGRWVARWADMDHVLSVFPGASMDKDFVAVPAVHIDSVTMKLRSKGLLVALADDAPYSSDGDSLLDRNNNSVSEEESLAELLRESDAATDNMQIARAMEFVCALSESGRKRLIAAIKTTFGDGVF